jgi:glycosyltransferase involved in cell wall biosynthesis
MAPHLDTGTPDERRLVPVSVVIPCFRCAETIGRAVASVAAQTRLPGELILVEDCSDDGGRTLAALHDLRERHAAVLSVIVASLDRNVGPGEARNAGWNLATREFVAFLDSDDSWHPEKLEMQTTWLIAHPEYALACHQTVRLSTAAPRHLGDTPAITRDIGRLGMLFRNSIPTRSVMIRRNVGHRFPPGVRYAEDYFLWLQVLYGGGRAAKLPWPLAYSYKEEFGERGLSASLERMHRGVLHCFDQLRRQGRISTPLFAAATLFERIKQIRRRALTAVRGMSTKATGRTE